MDGIVKELKKTKGEHNIMNLTMIAHYAQLIACIFI